MQQTRLGKFVNELRRKTEDRDLSRRAKNLVRIWQQVALGNGHSVEVNGDIQTKSITESVDGRVPNSSLKPSWVPTDPRIQRVSAMTGSKPTSPASLPGTPNSIKSAASPASPVLKSLSSFSVGTNKLTSRGSVNNLTAISDKADLPHSLSTTKIEPLDKRVLLTDEGITDSNSKKRKREVESNGDVKKRKANCDYDSAITDNSKRNVIFSLPDEEVIHNGHSIARTNNIHADTFHPEPAYSSKVTSSLPQQIATEQSSWKTADNAFIDKPPSPLGSVKSRDSSLRTPTISRLPKVKSTKELLQGLCESGELSLAANSETVARIAHDQIEREPDERDAPVVPSSLYRRRRGALTSVCPPSTSEKMLHQTKSELMQKFLASTTDDDAASSPLVVKLALNKVSEPSANDEVPTAEIKHKTEDELWVEQALKDPWSLLPAEYDNDETVVEDDNSLPMIAEPVTAEYVERLHSEQLPGLNGTRDNLNAWHGWHETFTVPSYGNHQLHILPYVDIDF